MVVEQVRNPNPRLSGLHAFILGCSMVQTMIEFVLLLICVGSELRQQ